MSEQQKEELREIVNECLAPIKEQFATKEDIRKIVNECLLPFQEQTQENFERLYALIEKNYASKGWIVMSVLAIISTISVAAFTIAKILLPYLPT